MKKENGEELKGFHGWLNVPHAIFCLIAAYLIYETFIGLIFSEYILCLGILISLPFIYTLYLSVKQKKQYVLWAIICSWLLILIPLHNFYAPIPMMDSISFDSLLGLSSNILIWAIIWTFYFLRSKRVKNTFVN